MGIARTNTEENDSDQRIYRIIYSAYHLTQITIAKFERN